jgi:hypothetical protein
MNSHIADLLCKVCGSSDASVLIRGQMYPVDSQPTPSLSLFRAYPPHIRARSTVRHEEVTVVKKGAAQARPVVNLPEPQPPGKTELATEPKNRTPCRAGLRYQVRATC